MIELPPGWAVSTLGEIVTEVRNGISAKPDCDDGIPILRISAVRPMKLNLDDTRYLPHDFQGAGAYLLATDDLLFTRYNGNRELVGVCARVRKLARDTVYPDKLIRVRVDPAVASAAFIERAVHVAAARNFIADKLKTSAGQIGVSGSDLKRLPISIAPLPEQKRIANKLDSLLERADACRERLDRVPNILKRFRQSVLAAATSGELTREWREAHGVSSAWKRSSVADVAAQVFDGPFGSHLKSNDYVASGIRVVRLENIAPLRFIENKRTYISQLKYEGLAKHTLLANDVLFSSFVDEEVRVCLIPEELGGRAINKADCFCIRVDAAKCRPMFLALQLACRTTFEGLEDMVHGATRPRINLGQLRAIQLKLPSVDEQEEVIQRSTALLELADNLERRLAVVRGYVERTTPSALAKAFRGELVPQNPNEEPASDLLARIGGGTAAPRTAGQPKRSGAREPRAKTKGKTDMLARKDVPSTHLTSILKERGALTAEALWTASQLDIDEFYDQLKDEEARGLLRENRGDSPTAARVLEAAA